MPRFDAEVASAFLAEHHLDTAHDPFEPYQGVTALFNADLHRADPAWAPREDWEVVSPYKIKHLPITMLQDETDENNANG